MFQPSMQIRTLAKTLKNAITRKHKPHQGARECARRRRQLANSIIHTEEIYYWLTYRKHN